MKSQVSFLLHKISDYQFFVLLEEDLEKWANQLTIEDDLLFDLIKKCLKFGPEDRIRKEQLLTHEWFKNDTLIGVVGTTGTGKTSLVSIMTGFDNLGCGSGPSSMTKQCQLVVNARKNQTSPIWMDTMGFDDSQGAKDTETFRQILKQVDSKKLNKVAALIWTISPEERSSQRLKRQAEFINQFREGNIWSNVIIICKIPMGWNLGKACQGALEAAKEVSGTSCADVQLVGLSIQEFLKFDCENMDQSTRDQFFIVSKEETVEKLDAILEKYTDDPIQVIFQDAECSACGVIGDKRLLPDFCHFKEELVHRNPEMMPFHPKELVLYHPGKLNQIHTQRMVAFHSQGLVSYHPGQLRQIHSGGTYPKRMADPDAAIRGWFGRDILGNSITVTLCSTCDRELDTRGCSKEYSCCLRDQYSNGCLTRYGCCGGSGGPGCARKYPCCGALENQESGCSSEYSCCDNSIESRGCSNKYGCCGAAEDSGGCQRQYLCCKKIENELGCIWQCMKCKQEWGTLTTNCSDTDSTPHRLVITPKH